MLRKYLLLPAAIGLALLLAIISRQPPAGDAGTGFSLPKATATLTAIAGEPRPVGSPAHDRARDWLIANLTGLGLNVTTQKDVGIRQANFDGRRGGAISVSPYENIIAVLPGTNPSAKAVLLMAHYDSVPYADGASDDAAGVASLLETARVLAKGQKPLRDTIFLLTDAEEVGLIGAQEFFDRHPLAPRVGVVINAEARGSRGRALMFQTSKGNAGILEHWASNAVAPAGNSLANAVYQQLPNDTDLSVPLAKGIVGINAAYIDGLHDYHMPTDSIANIAPESLQHLGNFVLTTTRSLSNASALPDVTGAERAYFDVLGLFVMRYPMWLGWALAALSGAGLVVAAKRLGVRSRQALLATVGTAALVAGAAAISHYLGQWMYGVGMVSIRDRINEMDPALWLFFAFCGGLLLLFRPKAPLWIGALIVAFLASIAAQILLPGANWLFVWPSIIGAFLALLAARKGIGASLTLWTSAAATIAVGAVLLANVFDLYMTVAPLTAAPVALMTLFVIVLATPLLMAFKPAKITGGVLLLAAAAGTIWFASTDRFSPRYPMIADLFYHQSNDTSKSWWATTSGRAQLPSGPVSKISPYGFDAIKWTAVPAPAIAAEMPTITQEASGGIRRIRITSPTAPRSMTILFSSSALLTNAKVNGRSVKIPRWEPIRIAWRPETPNAELIVEADDSQASKIDIAYLYAIAGLPSGAPPAKGLPTDWAHLNGTRSFSGRRQIVW
jgi:acetylornithine deacetylase/succinyl-diaminopimelate desuccinylase-like protein